MANKPGYGLFTALILLLCLIPSAGMFLPDRSETGGNEALSPAPSLRDGAGDLNTAYLSQLLDYVEDNYFLRQKLVTVWSALNAGLLRTSITEDVVLGGNGWLYFGGTLADYTGTGLMDQREIASAARNLALIQEYCAGQGARFLFAIAPNKNSLYPEHMPPLTVQPGVRNAEALAEALAREGVAYLDLFTLFREQEETLYFEQDSHWNSRGAALAADAVNEALARERESQYFDGPFTLERSHRGDLCSMLYPAGGGLEPDWKYGGALNFQYDAPIRSAENMTIRTRGRGENSLLMFRDSFGNLLYPYLADSFDAALFSRSMPCRLDLLARQEADCVVVELVERNLRYLIQNVPLMPAPRRGIDGPGVPDTCSAVFDLEPSDSLPGYTLVTGFLPAASGPELSAAAQEPPVIVATEDGCYEAFLLEDSRFGLYLPEGRQPLGIACRGAASGAGTVRLRLIEEISDSG